MTDENVHPGHGHDAAGSGADPAATEAALPIAGPALVDEDAAPEGDLDPDGSVLPPPRLEGTQPGGLPAHRFE